MAIPWNTIQGFAGTTGIGAILALGIYLILLRIFPSLRLNLDSYINTYTWGFLASIPTIAIFYIIGLQVVLLSSFSSELIFGAPEIDGLERIIIVSKTKNNLLTKHLFTLHQKVELLNGSTISFFILGVACFLNVKKSEDFKKVVVASGILSITISIVVFLNGNIMDKKAENFTKRIDVKHSSIKKEVVMDNFIVAIINNDVEIEYESPNGSKSTETGKLLSLDSNGYVVIERRGKKIYINKDKVHVISEQSD